MNKLNKIEIWGIILIVICAFCFYWYSYRPEKIRESCINTYSSFPQDYSEKFSRECILQHGLVY